MSRARPRSGHWWQLETFSGGWEVWACRRCRRWAVPLVFGVLWPDVSGALLRRWRCPGRRSPLLDRLDAARGGRVVVETEEQASRLRDLRRRVDAEMVRRGMRR